MSEIRKEQRLPINLILEARDGNHEAIQQVVAHYERKIVFLSTFMKFDKEGMPYKEVDEDIRAELQEILAEAITNWRELI